MKKRASLMIFLVSMLLSTQPHAAMSNIISDRDGPWVYRLGKDPMTDRTSGQLLTTSLSKTFMIRCEEGIPQFPLLTFSNRKATDILTFNINEIDARYRLGSESIKKTVITRVNEGYSVPSFHIPKDDALKMLRALGEGQDILLETTIMGFKQHIELSGDSFSRLSRNFLRDCK